MNVQFKNQVQQWMILFGWELINQIDCF